MIQVKDLTIQYPSKKGVFGLNFSIAEGEVMGYLGPNGAGKTTTIRGLMGFIKPDKGTCFINNLDCFNDSKKIKTSLGYVPGEASFPSGMTGDEFLKFMSLMRNTKDLSRQKELLEIFEFIPKGDVKKYSKGMKQKLSLVSAFMHNPDVIILDEPTSGLDPLMQNRFINLILEEKKKGKTILMSSHMFEEIEKTCDNVLIIRDGVLVAKEDIETLKNSQRKGYILKADNISESLNYLKNAGFECNILNDDIEVFVAGEDIDKFIKAISNLKINKFDTKTQNLEDIFMGFYSKEAK